MIANVQAKLAIGVAAGIWFVLALLTGQAVSTLALKTFSLAGAAVTILLLLYDRFIWRWKPVRLLTSKPLVAGTWRGELRSDYHPPGQATPMGPIPIAVRISQTDSTLLVTTFTDESQSTTEKGLITQEADGRWRIHWAYLNVPRQSVQHRSAQHRGACDVYLSGRDGERLIGQYFTSRSTTGEIELTEWSKQRYGDAKTALEAVDFGKARPFVHLQHRQP